VNKVIYLIGGREAETYQTFRDRMLATAEEAVMNCRPLRCWITLTVSPPPRISVIPFRHGKTAAITLIREPGDLKPCTLLTEMDGFRFAAQVDEALPRRYEKTWPDGTATPGICLLTIFRKKKDITTEQFLDRWHNSHTPLSLRIHPLWQYDRNVVLAPVAGQEQQWDGIVMEHFRRCSDLLNPFRFFGNPLVILPRMLEVYRDINTFLDYPTIETWMVQEYRIRS